MDTADIQATAISLAGIREAIARECSSETRVTVLRSQVPALLRDALGIARLMPEHRIIVAEIISAIGASQKREREACERERLRLEHVRLQAESVAAPFALGREDIRLALVETEGTASCRCLSMSDVIDVVATARANGRASCVEDHTVAKSYRYPVTYSACYAEKLDDGTVYLKIERTSTYGRREDTGARLRIPADMVLS